MATNEWTDKCLMDLEAMGKGYVHLIQDLSIIKCTEIVRCCGLQPHEMHFTLLRERQTAYRQLVKRCKAVAVVRGNHELEALGAFAPAVQSKQPVSSPLSILHA